MTIRDTQLYFLEADCLEQFGSDQGRHIFSLTEETYERLCQGADDRSSRAIREHLTMNLYPTMAYYRALREVGYPEAEALSLVRAETAKSAQEKKAEQERFAKIPGTYLLYRLCVGAVMKKKFPKEGWDTRWVRRDGEEIHFDFTRCLYRDICDEQGCPELCPVFCANDDVAFTGLMPKIRFERNGTLGRGDPCCDFHFIKNKRKGKPG